MMLLEDGAAHHDDDDDDTIDELGLQHKPERGEAWQLLVEAVHANPDRHDPALWLRWVAAFLAPHTGGVNGDRTHADGSILPGAPSAAAPTDGAYKDEISACGRAGTELRVMRHVLQNMGGKFFHYQPPCLYPCAKNASVLADELAGLDASCHWKVRAYREMGRFLPGFNWKIVALIVTLVLVMFGLHVHLATRRSTLMQLGEKRD